MSNPSSSLLADVEAGADRLRPVFLLGVRLFWGAQFALAGFGKLAHLDHATAAFAGWGFPAPGAHAALAGTTEFFGGLLLASGLLARPAALMLSVTMIIALGSAHRGELLATTLENPTSVLTALPSTFLLAALTVLFAGPGPLTVARLFGARGLTTPVVAGRGVSA